MWDNSFAGFQAKIENHARSSFRKKKMRTTVEYNSKLAIGDKITFYLDGETFTGKVSKESTGYWIDCSKNDDGHHETVDKIFSHFGISDRNEFRDRVIGHKWLEINGVWPYTDSLEDLKKMLDEL